MDGFAYSFRDFVAFFVEFENTIRQTAQPGILESIPRDPFEMLRVFHLHSGCEFRGLELDLSDGLANTSSSHSRETWSFVLNFEKTALIIINNTQREDGSPLVNHCYRRFLLLKEALHVILRDEFISRRVTESTTNEPEPDTGTPIRLAALVDDLVLRPFSIVDFDSDKYSAAIKIENFAELFALFLLYPIEDMARDRRDFLGNLENADFRSPSIIAYSTLSIANEYLIPKRYIDLMFRWDNFDEMYKLYNTIKFSSANISQNIVNQTKVHWTSIANVRSSSAFYSDFEKGTGIIVKYVSGYREFSHSSGVEYRAFQKFAAGTKDVVAYQWVPYSIASESAVLAADCGDNLPCQAYCVTPGCICLDGVCRRR